MHEEKPVHALDAEAEETAAERPSKSARKRDMLALQALGERLCALSPRELGRVPIEDPALASAIDEARRITSHSARRRHMQYIGKLMRSVDAAPLQAALDTLDAGRAAAASEFHALEAWRDRLLREGDAALPSLLAQWPQADRQHVRRLLRQHARETARGQAPTAARSLFRYLRTLPLPDAGSDGGFTAS